MQASYIFWEDVKGSTEIIIPFDDPGGVRKTAELYYAGYEIQFDGDRNVVIATPRTN